VRLEDHEQSQRRTFLGRVCSEAGERRVVEFPHDANEILAAEVMWHEQLVGKLEDILSRVIVRSPKVFPEYRRPQVLG